MDPSSYGNDVATALAAVARVLSAERDLPSTLSRACDLAVATIGACDHADVMVPGASEALTVPGASDWVGVRIVSIEAETGQGPCIDALESGALIDVPDLGAEQRWPMFVRRCLSETPVRSSLGVPLIVGERPIGAVDLYADRANAFDPEDVAAGALFAAHVAVAFAAAIEREQLRKALESRDLIGQAKGLLMAQSQVTSDEAFDLLRRASQRLNQKLVVVAQLVVEHAVSPPD